MKLIRIVLSSLVLLNFIAPIAVRAADTFGVNVRMGSSFKVTIPKVISLDGQTGSASYDVLVEGDIAWCDLIKVAPDASFELSQTNKSTVLASVTQLQTEFSHEHIKNTVYKTSGQVFTEDVLSGGSWTGSFDFHISVDSILDAGLYDNNNKLLKSWDKLLADNVIQINHSGITILDKNLMGRLVLSNEITEIKDSAFAGCNSLSGILIPDSVTAIQNNAFLNCSSLATVIIPDSVMYIGSSVFKNCRSLTSIQLSNNLLIVPDELFSGCTSLKNIVLPDSVMNLGNESFYNCKSLLVLEIPDVLLSIGSRSFSGCSSLQGLYVPDGTKYIGYEAFTGVSQVYYNGIAIGAPWGASHVN